MVSSFDQTGVRRLTAHRTLALQAELVQQPMTAAVALTHRLVLDTFYSCSWRRAALQIEVRTTALEGHAADLEGCQAAATIEAHRKSLKERLPDDPDALLPWLTKQSGGDLLAILAYCVAVTVDGVESREGPSPLDALAEAAQLDMRRYWKATAESYFGSVSKARILDVVREAVSPEVASAISDLKKGALAKAAEERLAGKGWLPATLRVNAA
jgi:ParB family chromosome partitioning protein